MRFVIVVVAALMFVGAASASNAPTVPWKARDMVTALRALAYPTAHPRKLTCRKSGPRGFRCAAINRRRQVFYTRGRGLGGWICAGKRPTSCSVLKHGFASTSMVAGWLDGSLATYAKLAAKGYVQNKYDLADPQSPSRTCDPWERAANSFVCEFDYNQEVFPIIITFKPAKGGWIIAGSG
jgi:hypothetical protein